MRKLIASVIAAASVIGLAPQALAINWDRARDMLSAQGLYSETRCRGRVVYVTVVDGKDSDEICYAPNDSVDEGRYTLNVNTGVIREQYIERDPNRDRDSDRDRDYRVRDYRDRDYRELDRDYRDRDYRNRDYRDRDYRDRDYRDRDYRDRDYRDRDYREIDRDYRDRDFREQQNFEFYNMSGGTVPPHIQAALRGVAAGQNLSIASCNSGQVQVVANGTYVFCAYPNGRYQPGKYHIQLDGLQ